MGKWLLVVAALGALALGCSPQIGDQCSVSTDCDPQGTLVCDTSQPGGYCTQLNCQGDLCPNYAACTLFSASVPGCPYNDRQPSRTGRAFCMKQCGSNGDCRDGYVCADPKQPPWNAIILDDDQIQLVCIVPPDNGVIGGATSTSGADAAVCQASGPPVSLSDASLPDASLTDAPREAAATDAGARDAADAAD